MKDYTEKRLILSKFLDDLPEFKVENVKCKHKLDQNESPFQLPKGLRKKILSGLEKYSFNRYPQPIDHYNKKKRISEFLDIEPDNLTFTAGADQGILAMMMISGEKCAIMDPTYPIYVNDAVIFKKKISKISLSRKNDFMLTKEMVPRDMDIVCLVSPNPPIGNIIDEEVVMKACDNNNLVVVDEAYYDYSLQSFKHLIDKYDNLAILRTFSKAGSIAGLRFGFIMGSERIISSCEKVLFTPYNLGLLHYALMDNFEDISMWALEYAKKTIKIRDEMYEKMKNKGLEVYKSHGNFILFRSDRKTYVKLLENGIKTRFFTIEDIEYIRITMGTVLALFA